MHGPFFAVMLGLEQAIGQPLIGVGAAVGYEFLDQLW